MSASTAYIRQFTKLHANKNTRHWTEATTYRAPHKPLLLLSIIDLFGHGRIQTNPAGENSVNTVIMRNGANRKAT